MPGPTTPQPNPESPFELGLAEQQALVSVQPVPNEALFTVIGSLEETGLKQIGAGEASVARVAEAMHMVFGQLADLEIVPPMSTDQATLVAGKVATYASMREVAAPKPRRGRRAKATDTATIPTDKPKP